MIKLTSMFVLYVGNECPYCTLVLCEIEELCLDVEVRDRGVPTYREELIAKGGKIQVPYFVDTDTGTEMYETGKIITYLRERYKRCEPTLTGQRGQMVPRV